MNKTKDTAKQIRATIEARKVASLIRRQVRINRQEWIEREKAGCAR